MLEFDVGSADAKKRFWLRPEDLRELPKETQYFGFAQGRASWYYRESDLLTAAIKKHGKDGYEKKVASRLKREGKKRARAESAASISPAAKKAKAVKDYSKCNEAMQRSWTLTLTKPESVKGTVGKIEMQSEYNGNVSVD